MRRSRLRSGGCRTPLFGDRRNPGRLLILRKFKHEGAEDTGFCGHCAKKLLEITTTPSNVPGAKELALYRKAAQRVRLMDVFRYVLLG